jgi:hypothetical protein
MDQLLGYDSFSHGVRTLHDSNCRRLPRRRGQKMTVH